MTRPHVNILVLCDANVCRSVYASAILADGLKDLGVTVRSAALSGAAGLRPCGWVWLRCQRGDLQVPSDHVSKPCTQHDIDTADLILVMTALQESAVAARAPEARRRTMRLAQAVVVAEAVRSRGTEFDSLADWVSELDLSRSRTPIPLSRGHQRSHLFGRARSIAFGLDIEDEHMGSDRAHAAALDLVAEHSLRLVKACTDTLRLVAHERGADAEHH